MPDAAVGYAREPIARLQVIIAESAQEDFGKLPEHAQQLIAEALSLDPRPAAPPRRFAEG